MEIFKSWYDKSIRYLTLYNICKYNIQGHYIWKSVEVWVLKVYFEIMPFFWGAWTY